MNKQNKNIALKNKLINLYEENKNLIFKNEPQYISNLRNQAIEKFYQLGFPTTKMEGWRNTDLTKALSKNYNHFFSSIQDNVNVEELFKCEIHNFDTDIVSFLNGFYVNGDSQLKTMSDGTVVGSLTKAIEQYPEIFEKYYNKNVQSDKNAFVALNTAFAQDGLFIYVPDGVEVNKAIQMVSIINHNENLFIQNRNLIILGKNSRLTLVHCDDSINQQSSFNNSVTEIFVEENANLDHYKLQNLNNDSTLINSTFVHQKSGSNASTNSITLNGGLIRNDTFVKLNGQLCDANVYGVYLMDKTQHIDNHVFIDHAEPNCSSNELFKGILDEDATGVFNGHILVRRNAQKTSAFQSNKNILLTDTASIDTQPFLEIYADDVKCGHGATVGQLDTEAMFYLRSRGITEANARLLLMYAFAAEVINKISIKPLRDRIDDMVKKRLRGELSICDKCVLHCGSPEKEIHFDIDMSKI